MDGFGSILSTLYFSLTKRDTVRKLNIPGVDWTDTSHNQIHSTFYDGDILFEFNGRAFSKHETSSLPL